MVRRNVSLEHQLCVTVLLRNVITGKSELVLGIMPRSVEHQSHGGVVVGIERKSVLPLHLVAVGLYRS